MLTWEEYTYDMYLEKDVFVLTWVLCTYLIDICVMTCWDFFKLEWVYLKILNLDHTEFAKFGNKKSKKFTPIVFLPLVCWGDASKALMPSTNYLHFSKCHKYNFIIGSENLAELLSFPT